jgi:hypothetical protein
VAGSGNQYRLWAARAAGVAPATNVPDVYPSATFNGTPDSGYAGAPPIPTAVLSHPDNVPDLTGWKPMAAVVELFKPFMTLTGDAVIGWAVEFGGRAHTFEVLCEGNTISVPRKTWQVRTDANGNAVIQYGYHVKYKTSTHLAANPNTLANLYVRITPADTTNFKTKIAGPFPINARTSEFTVTKTFSRSTGTGADYTGQDAIRSCLNYAYANQAQFINFKCIETAQYRVAEPTAGLITAATNFVVFTADTGVICTLGDGSLDTANGRIFSSFGHNNVCLRGARIKMDLALMGVIGTYWGTSLSLSSVARDRMWLDGIEIFFGDGEGVAASAASRGITGSGAQLLKDGYQSDTPWMYRASPIDHSVALFDCYIHGMQSYGVPLIYANINPRVDGVSGSCFESAGHVYGGTSTNIGGVVTDVRTYKHALDISFAPTGGATAFYVERPLNNGVQSDFCIYMSNKNITASISGSTMTVTAVSGVTLAVGDHIGVLSQYDSSNIKISALGTGTGGTGAYTITRQGSSAFSSRTMYVAQGGYAMDTGVYATTQALAARINLLSGFTATADGSQIRPTSYLTYHDGNIQPSYPIYPVLAPSNAISLDTIFDAHCDVFVSNGYYREGFIWGFHTTSNIVATAWISMGSGYSVDCYMANLEGYDTSAAYAAANPAQADLCGVSPGYGGGAYYNLNMDRCSIVGDNGTFSWSGGSQFDANCGVRRSAVAGFDWSSPDPDVTFLGLVMNYKSSAGLPSGMTSGNFCKLAGYSGNTVAASTYMSVTTMVPVSAGLLLLGDTTYAGSRVPTAQIDNSAIGNYGWNLAA